MREGASNLNPRELGLILCTLLLAFFLRSRGHGAASYLRAVRDVRKTWDDAFPNMVDLRAQASRLYYRRTWLLTQPTRQATTTVPEHSDEIEFVSMNYARPNSAIERRRYHARDVLHTRSHSTITLDLRLDLPTVKLYVFLFFCFSFLFFPFLSLFAHGVNYLSYK